MKNHCSLIQKMSFSLLLKKYLCFPKGTSHDEMISVGKDIDIGICEKINISIEISMTFTFQNSIRDCSLKGPARKCHRYFNKKTVKS